MALTSAELEFLSREVWRVLEPGGLNVYTVRHTGDAHYGAGIHRGEDLYEMGGFIVHCFLLLESLIGVPAAREVERYMGLWPAGWTRALSFHHVPGEPFNRLLRIC